jgi:sugar phosphate isomerase/epimerase
MKRYDCSVSDLPSLVGRPRVGIALNTFRTEAVEDLPSVVARVAAMGYEGIEPSLFHGLPVNPAFQGWAEELPPLDAGCLKVLLDDHGLAVPSAHGLLPGPDDVEAILDQHAALGNELLVLTAPFLLDGFAFDTFEHVDAIDRLANRFGVAAGLAAERGMRVGFHNHQWEWGTEREGVPGYERFFALVDPAVFAEVDVYWAQVAGRDPAHVIADLGERALLLHVKDGPVEPLPVPQTALGDGKVDVRGVLGAGDHVRWHIVEIDRCEGDVFDLAERSLRYLQAQEEHS